MQAKSSQLAHPRALVKPHSGCTSISIHATWETKDLIRAVLLFLFPLGAVLMAPAALWSQTVSFVGAQTMVGTGLNHPFGMAVLAGKEHSSPAGQRRPGTLEFARARPAGGFRHTGAG